MCFQGFVYFACGHNKIMTHDCELALGSGNPYYIKHQCPDYNSSSERPNFQCGLGRYYCGESVDGPFLDHVHQSAATAQFNMNQLDGQIADQRNRREAYIAAARSHGLSDQACQQTSRWKYLVEEHKALMKDRSQHQKIHIDATAIIQQALQYYRGVRDRFGKIVPQIPFVPDRSMFGQFDHPAPRPWCGTGLPWQQSSTILEPAPQPQLPSPARTNLAETPRYTASNTAFPPFASSRLSGNTISTLANNVRMVQQAEMARQRNVQPAANQERKVSRQRANTTARPQKSKATSSKVADEDLSEEEIEVVRRSARVRNKKVNYAEDGGSSVPSREPSPAKSDVSAFSPLKSDASSSGEQDGLGRTTGPKKPGETPHTLRRPASSLSDKIVDWSKRSTIIKGDTSNARRTMPDIQDLLNSSPAPDAHTSEQTLTQQEAQSSTQWALGEQINTFKKPIAPYRALLATPQSSKRCQTSTVASTITQQGQVSSVAPMSAPTTSTLYGAAHYDGSYVPNFGPLNFGGERSSNLMMSSASWEQISPSPLTQLHQDLSISRSFQSKGVRTDSITEHDEEEQTEHVVDVESYYGSLRRSFGSGTSLPPAKSSNPAFGDLERKKRLSSTFVGNPEPRKRMRLSLPGEEAQASTPPAPNWLLGQGLTMNTEDGGTPYVPVMIQEQGSVQSPKCSPPLSAPSELPIAGSTAATAPLALSTLDGVAQDVVPPTQSAVHTAADPDTAESGPDFSDIDWGHHDQAYEPYGA